MANYVTKEMPSGMGNGKKGRKFPKMQVYTEFDYDKVVEPQENSKHPGQRSQLAQNLG